MLVPVVGDILVFMKIKMISWNVRGLNDPWKRLVVKNLLREWKCDVVCLQETKIASMNRRFVVCGAVHMWIGLFWRLIGLLVVFCLCGIKGFWIRWR